MITAGIGRLLFQMKNEKTGTEAVIKFDENEQILTFLSYW